MKHLFLMFILSCCVHVSQVWAAAPDDDVLVTWRDLNLTRADYEAALRAIPEVDRFSFQLSMQRITGMLNSLLLIRTLAAEGRELGLDKDPVVQSEIVLATEKVLAKWRVEAFETSLKIPDLTAVAEERYRIKPEEFRTPEQVHAFHVLVDTKTRSEEEASARAGEVRRRALAGADFGGLASEFSDDPSTKNNQGDLGFFGRGSMVKPFEDAAFALEKPGDISPVVKTQFGYHVILLREKQPARQKSFAEVKDALIEQIRAKYVEAAKNRHAEAITTDKSIVLNTAALDRLKKEAPKIPATTKMPAVKNAPAPTPGK
jgi:peptidyl-prolyl cis-trans isomerase C